MATLILTAVGTAIGGPVGGALGALLGRSVDQMVLGGGSREGPRLSDLQVQTSTYGSQVPQIFGTMRVAGTVIWATDLRETKTKSGGGKGRPSVTQYSYAASFAVALSARRAMAVGRIWADGNLLRGSAGDFKSEIGAFRFHDGSGDQPLDPLIAAAQGIAQTPAHRGIAYVLFEDLALADFGNRIPSLTFELIADDGEVEIGAIARALSGGRVTGEDAGAVMGYAASGESMGVALQPLVEAEGLRLCPGEDGLVLSGRRTGDGDVVRRDRLVARMNGAVGDAWRLSRQSAEAVPVRLSVRHYDPARDYQAGIQKAVRPGPGRSEASIEMPAVIGAARARTLADRRLARDWAGRRQIDLTGDWSALPYAAGRLVQVEDEPGLWLVETQEWDTGGVALHLRRMAQGGGLAVPVSSGSAVSQADVVHGPTTLLLADLPPLDDAAPVAATIVAAAAGASAGWRRAALFTVAPASGIAEDAGQTAPAATLGQVVTPPGDGATTLFDDLSSMDVELLADDMVLMAADDAALGQGANLCLVGRELVQFGRVQATGPRRFRLTRLLRGRRGSEWACAGHDAGEPFLMIDAERLAAVPASAVHPGATLSMMAIGIGDLVPAAASLAISGEALIPLAPVHLHVTPDGVGGRRIGWTRRSRAGWRWNDGVDAPLGEEGERYAITVTDGATVVRTAESAVAEWTYDAGMAAADAAAGFGGPLVLSVRQLGTFAIGRAATVALTA
ncbi:phage tail protein [Sphingobium aquiterrae]|uniref:phage tail protein n=1 Tax=Sphingobium aquiterrae TaxID=2038656 RepID=UPI00301820D9